MSGAVENILKAAGARDEKGLLLAEGRKRALEGALDDARILLARRLEISPDDPLSLRIMAFTEMGLGDMASARECLLRLQHIAPDEKGTLVNLFTVSSELGLRDEAVKYSERAVRLYPECGEAHFYYARSTRYDAQHWHIPVLEKAYAKASPGSLERKLMGFALYTALHGAGRYEEAFAALSEANAIARTELPYSHAREEGRAMALMAAFSPDKARSFAQHGFRGPKPVFIVGMPRSGSTLAEQILASHRDVFGGGENDVISNLIASNFLQNSGDLTIPDMQKMSPERILAAGKFIADEQQKRSGSKPRYVEKSLFNFLWVGYILSMLPDAKIIHMRRSPLALCLANYEASFGNREIRFIYDLEATARYYVLQERLMAWWKVLYPGSILELSYEELTLDQRGQTERLLAFCELDWDENCLAFHMTERTVSTASANQVRQPLYSGIDRKTQHYREQLEPAAKILKEAGLL